MMQWSDKDFAKAGWKWLHRDRETGKPLGCTVLAADAGMWMNADEGEVIALFHLKEGQENG